MQNRRLKSLIFFCLLAASLAAQTPGLNPFDIIGRLPKNLQTAAVEAYNKPAVLSDTIGANPFDMAPHISPGAAPGIGASMGSSFQPLEVLPTGDALSDIFVFWMLVVLLVFLSFAIAAKRNIVVKAWRGFINENALTIAQKEASGFIGSTPYYLLYGSFLLNAGAFIFLIARHFDQKTFNNPGFLIVCMLLSGSLFLAKHLFLSIVAWLYPVNKQLNRYNFLIIIFNCVLGLFLVPFNFLIAFVKDYGDFMVYWTLALAGIFYLYRSLRAAAIGQKYLRSHLFHFLLYLCTVEIAPVAILIKLAMLASN